MNDLNRIVVVAPSSYEATTTLLQNITVDSSMDDGFWGFIQPNKVSDTLLQLPLDSRSPVAVITATSDEIPEAKVTTVPTPQGVLSTQIIPVTTFLAATHSVEVFAPELTDPELARVLVSSICSSLNLEATEAKLQKSTDDSGDEKPVLTLSLEGKATGKSIHEEISRHLGTDGSIFSRSVLTSKDNVELLEERMSTSKIAEAALFLILTSSTAIKDSLVDASKHASIKDYLVASANGE